MSEESFAIADTRDKQLSSGAKDLEARTKLPRPVVPVPQAQQQLEFIISSDSPSQSSKQASKKLIRRHAALSTHSKARRARVLEYQQSLGSARAPAEKFCTCPEVDITHVTDSEFCSQCGKYKDATRAFETLMKRLGGADGGLGNGKIDPFHSLAKDLTRFEESLFDHYVNHVMTQKHAHQVAYSGTEGIFDLCMNKRLAAVTITETGLLHGGVFLMACRSLALKTNKPIYNIQALKYKGIMISITKEAIEKNTKEGTIDDTTIIKVLYLASDEFHTGNIEGTKNHTKAIGHLVKMKGGLEKLGMEGLLRRLVLWNDRTSSFYTGTNPDFMHHHQVLGSAIVDFLTRGFLSFFEMGLFSFEMTTLLNEICQFNYTTFAEIPAKEPYPSAVVQQLKRSNFDVRLLVLSSDHRCPASSRRYTDIEECLSLALMVYVRKILLRLDEDLLGATFLVSRMQVLLKRIMSGWDWELYKDILLWMAFMCAYAQSPSVGLSESCRNSINITWHEDYKWLQDLMLAVVEKLGVTCLAGFRLTLEGFLWTEEQLNDFAETIWSSLVLHLQPARIVAMEKNEVDDIR